MFSDIVHETPLSGFGDIGGVSCCVSYGAQTGPIDNSLEATVRALTIDRCTEQGLPLRVGWLLNPSTDITDTLFIVKVSARDHKNDRFLEERGYAEDERVRVFFRKIADIRCFTNRYERSSVVWLPHNCSMGVWHAFQAGLPVYLPWLFEKRPVTPTEKDLLSSLSDDTPARYLSLISEISETLDLRGSHIRGMLASFETWYSDNMKRSLDAEYKNITGKIDFIRSELSDLMSKRRAVCERIAGISVPDGCGEFSAYFERNKNLDLISFDDGVLRFRVKTRLAYYSEDAVKRLLKNKKSYLYRYADEESVESLMRAVLIDRTIGWNLTAEYVISLKTLSVHCQRNAAFRNSYSSYMPNVHADAFDCLGDYHRLILDCIDSGDYISAVEQCVAACGSLNFMDPPVITETMRRVFGKPGVGREGPCCFVLPTGETVTAQQAVEWLKGEKEIGVEAW